MYLLELQGQTFLQIYVSIMSHLRKWYFWNKLVKYFLLFDIVDLKCKANLSILKKKVVKVCVIKYQSLNTVCYFEYYT